MDIRKTEKYLEIKEKFESLPKEEQDFWNNFAEKQQKLIASCWSLMSEGCIYCKKKFPNMAEMEFHIKSTHGIPSEILTIMMGYKR